MKTIFEVFEPRPEIRNGELNADHFAANLRKVVDSYQSSANLTPRGATEANPLEAIYTDAEKFFEHTFATENLQELAAAVFESLIGVKKTGSPAIRLETSFGGGKTHDLIALYHLAKTGKSMVNFY